MKNKIVILIISVLFISGIPVFHTYVQNRTSWAGVIPSFANDDVYYYARMQNIVHGYPFIGNPYFFEHRQEISPAFFVSDWLATAPIFIGIPFTVTVVVNFILWSMIFSIFAYFLFIRYGLPRLLSVAWALLSYAITYILILRPVSMQVVAPFFLFFCITYAIWLKTKFPTRLQNILLTISIALSFYIYTYLWQVIVVVCGLTTLFLIYRKEWIRLKYFIINGSIAGILALPAIFYTLKQVSSPYYWETMTRIGLINTHIPTALSFYDSGMIFIILCLWSISYMWTRSLRDNTEYVEAFIFVSLLGVALCITLFSNVITGKELEISNHIERFVTIWISISFLLYIWFAIKFRFEIYSLSFYKKGLIVLSFAVSIAIFVHFLFSDFSIKYIIQKDTVSIQAYGAPLNWLNINIPKESVVWSNGDIGEYIPIQTTDFQLFNPAGGLHLVSNKEIEERYLISHYFDNLSVSDIERDFRVYAGVGNSIHQYKTHNRRVKICILLYLKVFGVNCGEQTDAVSFKGEKYFADLYNQYKNDIYPNIISELRKYNVTYIIKDNKMGGIFYPEKIPHTKLLWNNDRFFIYSIQYQ